MAELPELSSRRHWLLRGLEVGILASLAVFLYPLVRFLTPRATTSSGALETLAPYSVSDLKPDAEGRWPAPFNFGGKPCLLVRTPDGEIKAFNAICTHVDCTVEYRAEEGDIFCNCHNGVYDLNGHNVSGPPPRPLEEYKVTRRGPKQEEILVSRKA